MNRRHPPPPPLISLPHSLPSPRAGHLPQFPNPEPTTLMKLPGERPLPASNGSPGLQYCPVQYNLPTPIPPQCPAPAFSHTAARLRFSTPAGAARPPTSQIPPPASSSPAPSQPPPTMVEMLAVAAPPPPPLSKWALAHAAAAARPHPRLHASAHLLPIVECVLLDRVALGAAAPAGPRRAPSAFHAIRAPSVSPVDYLHRLVRNAHCSRAAFVVALILLDRAAMRRPDLALTPLNVHRLLLTAVLLATKVLDDVLYDNAHFAFVGGLDVQELNMLELDLLHVLAFRLHVDADTFADYERTLVHVVLKSANPDYANLRFALQNVGYKAAPHSPKSIMPTSV